MKTILHKLILAAVILTGAATFQSCDDDDWDPIPPYGWSDYFYDSHLTGVWQLARANANPVAPSETNYLDFYGNGRGEYYYYDNGQLVSEQMGYFCQPSNFGNSRYQINIQYEFGEPATMNYWFTDGGRALWMQWTTNRGPVTYLYRPASIPY